MTTALIDAPAVTTAGGIEGRDEADRISALDGLRGFAVLWVMLHHFTHGATHHNPLLNAGFTFARYGYWGVDVFFVLSGFLITGVLHDSKNASNYLSAFYARRSLRIFPLYFAALIIVFVLLPMVHTLTPQQHAMAQQQGWLWAYMGNLAMVFHNAPIYDAGGIKLLHFWSLAIEEQFYLVWPAVVLMLSRVGLMRVCVSLVLVAAASRFTLNAIGIGEQVASFFTLSRVDGLALGALVALVARGPGGLVKWIGKAPWFGFGFAVTLGLVLAARQSIPELAQYWIPMLRLGLFMCVLVLAVGASGWTSRIFSMRWLSFLGKYSYGLYVFHYMMMPLMDRWVSTERMSNLLGSFIVGMAAHLAICIGASIVVALLSWHLLEKHFLKLKRHFVPHGRDAHATERRGGYEQAQGQTVSVTVFAPAIRSCSTASTSR